MLHSIKYIPVKNIKFIEENKNIPRVLEVITMRFFLESNALSTLSILLAKIRKQNLQKLFFVEIDSLNFIFLFKMHVTSNKLVFIDFFLI